MVVRPKRRKNKDNPYTLYSDESNNKRSVSFKDNRGTLLDVEISIEVYNEFNEFELNDLSQMNKDDLHKDYRIIDNTEESEITIFHSLTNNQRTIEEIVEQNIINERVKQYIEELPEIQKRRLKKYYYEDKSFEQIAREEKCTKIAVKFSVDIALEKIIKKIKK